MCAHQTMVKHETRKNDTDLLKATEPHVDCKKIFTLIIFPVTYPTVIS